MTTNPQAPLTPTESGKTTWETGIKATDPDPSNPMSGVEPLTPETPLNEPPPFNRPLDLPTAEMPLPTRPPNEEEAIRAMTPLPKPARRKNRKSKQAKPSRSRSNAASPKSTPPLDDPLAAELPPSPPSEEASAVPPPAQAASEPETENAIPQVERARLMNPQYQKTVLRQVCSLIGLRLTRLPDEIGHEAEGILMWIIEGDLESGVADSLFTEIHDACNGLWGDRKIVSIIMALRAAEAVSRTFLGAINTT